jgi:hypothetical protein
MHRHGERGADQVEGVEGVGRAHGVAGVVERAAGDLDPEAPGDADGPDFAAAEFEWERWTAAVRWMRPNGRSTPPPGIK